MLFQLREVISWFISHDMKLAGGTNRFELWERVVQRKIFRREIWLLALVQYPKCRAAREIEMGFDCAPRFGFMVYYHEFYAWCGTGVT